MKKLLVAVVTALAAVIPASALPLGIFDHVGVGAGVGTTGITIEAATPITHWVQMRAGVSIMPSIKFGVDADVDYTANVDGQQYPRTTEVNLKGDLSRVQGQIIFNVYPIPFKSLFIAAGAYFGGSTIVGINGHSADLEGIEDGQVTVGDYTLPVDQNGNVKGGIKVNGFRPYLGIGWGRAVPGKLVNFQVDLGVQFHGKPSLYTDFGDLGVPKEIDDDTFQKIMDKVKVYPTLTFRINFRPW
nr:hypothetical protein [Bacteroides sp.]